MGIRDRQDNPAGNNRSSKNTNNNRKRVLEGIFFLFVMGLSFYTVFHGQNLMQIADSLKKLSPAALLLAVLVALFFVSAEGMMIWYLLRSMNGKSGIWRCISYSFIGFFYSGITPSATGGQPMQLYYMCKDKNSLSASSVALMTVALLYKFVLVLIGGAILLFWQKPLRMHLQEYFPLFLLGLSLNTLLVAILFSVMLCPRGMSAVLRRLENALVKCRLLTPSGERTAKIAGFVDGYREAVHFLLAHKGKVFVVCLATFLQRCSVFVLTWVIYRGFSLEGTDMLTVLCLQASVYIAVDMLPVPGAQGITELMYCSVFDRVFAGTYLMPSLYVNRGISFYFLLLVGIAVTLYNLCIRKRGDR